MLADFYRGVLAPEGNYALFQGWNKQHVWCGSVDELTSKTESLAHKPDLYFALASFAAPTERTAVNAATMGAFFFDIDAGPTKFAKHGDRVYETQAAARSAVVAWCLSNNLMPSYVLSSGEGLHVYFRLAEPALVADWKPVAESLKAMAMQQGLRIDAAVTADAARVLRPPGTLHHSGKPVTVLLATKHVTTLDKVREKTAGFRAPHAPAKARVSRINDDVLAAPVGPPKTVVKIIERCAAIRHATEAGGNVPEPYWRAMLGVIKHTVEGETAAHQYSQGYSGYNYADTQAKFERWAAGPSTCATLEAENPSACAGCKYRGTIRSPILLGQMTPDQVAQLPPAAEPEPEPSEDSPFADDTEDASPRAAGAADPWTEFLPEHFKVRVKGAGHAITYEHMVPIVNEAGDKVEIQVETAFAAVPFWFESWASGTSESDQAVANYCVWNQNRRQVTRHTFPTRLAAKRDTIFSALAEQNIQVFPSTNHAKAAMEDFVKASLERIRAISERDKIQDRFGTSFSNEGDVIVAQGMHVIDRTGRIVEGVVHDRLRGRGQAYKVPVPPSPSGVWGPEVWAEYIEPRAQRHVAYLREFYDDPNFSPYQLAIMLAWASPMLAFMQGNYHPGTALPGSGLTVSLYSPVSGIGKTSAMHAAALAFGSPSAVCLQLDRNSATANARQAAIVQCGTLPSFLDEMEDVPAQDLAAMISAVGNGASKSRMTRELSLVGGSTTSLVNIMSTNKSHREIVAADRDQSSAVQMRLLEIECSGVQPVSAERANQETEARAALHDCAGAVGAMIHRRMCALGPVALNALGLQCATNAREMLRGKQDGRLMWRVLGAMLAVRRMLKSDGLQVFALDTLRDEFKKWHDAGYEFSSGQGVELDGPALMAQFLSDMSGSTLITQGENQRHGRHGLQLDIPLNDRIPSTVVARAVLDQGYVYVRTSALKDWAAHRKMNSATILTKCRLAGLLEGVGGSARSMAHRIDLFKGTKLAQGVRDSCVKVLMAKLPGEVITAPLNSSTVVELRRAGGEPAGGEVSEQSA